MKQNHGKPIHRKLMLHKDKIKAAIGIMTVLVAVLFFGIYGDKYGYKAQSEYHEKGESEEGLRIMISEDEGDSQRGEASDGSQGGEGSDGSQSHRESPSRESESLICDISGAVAGPGVYYLKDGDRLVDLIALAGGLTEDADIDAINRAEKVYDGQKIYIPTKEETKGEKPFANNNVNGNVNNTGNNGGVNSNSGIGGKININTASSEELQRIPGIGPVTAEKIIDYRNANGNFTATEDLKKISGIGEKTYKKMAEYVTV